MPDYDFSIKQHDLEPPLEVQLTQKGTQEPIDLTNATQIRMVMVGQKTRHRVSTLCARVFDTAINPADSTAWGFRSGRVAHLWVGPTAGPPVVAGETDTADVYNAEFEITWAGAPGRPQTVPNKGYKEIEIYPDLG